MLNLPRIPPPDDAADRVSQTRLRIHETLKHNEIVRLAERLHTGRTWTEAVELACKTIEEGKADIRS